MRTGRLVLSLLAGLVVAGVVFAASQVPVRSEENVPVVVAARDLPARSILSAADLRTIDMPRRAVPAGAITTVESVLRRVLRDPLYAGEPLNEKHLALKGTDLSDSILIPGNKSYAFNMPISMFISAPPRLQLHDRIDIVGYQRGKSVESGGVIVSDLEVIDFSPNFNDNATESRYLTVAVTSEEILRILGARDGYTLAAALRPFAKPDAQR
jgi:Flp pilus assembly protein CpaB